MAGREKGNFEEFGMQERPTIQARQREENSYEDRGKKNVRATGTGGGEEIERNKKKSTKGN